MTRMAHYKSNGYLWEEGEVPKCDYCGRTPEQDTLWETPHSGVILCTATSCLQAYTDDNIYQEQIELIEDDDDGEDEGDSD